LFNFDTETNKLQMPSIIEGYNYDIFIYYRQKDNKGDRWVSKFYIAAAKKAVASQKIN